MLPLEYGKGDAVKTTERKKRKIKRKLNSDSEKKNFAIHKVEKTFS